MSYPNDMSRLADGITAEQVSRTDFSSSANAAKTGRRLIRRTYGPLTSAALNANASNAVAPNAAPCFVPVVAGRVLGARGTVTSNVTAAGPGNATLAIVKLGTDGTTGATAASATTNTVANGGIGNLTLGIPFALTASSNVANARYTANQPLALSLTENGTGVALPAGQYFLDVEEESPIDGYK